MSFVKLVLLFIVGIVTYIFVFPKWSDADQAIYALLTAWIIYNLLDKESLCK